MKIFYGRNEESVKDKGELFSNIRKRKRAMYNFNSVESKNSNRIAVINN
jgi:hypothetical protein